jgi:hypothetical protein
VALVLTALVLVQSIRELDRGHHGSGWLFPASPLIHGWALIAANVLIYAWFCWITFWFVRGTRGPERFLILGWVSGILLWPFRMSWPESLAIRSIGVLGLIVALLASVSLLLRSLDTGDPQGLKPESLSDPNRSA